MLPDGDPRYVPIGDGSVSWLFPGHAADDAVIVATLINADEQLGQVAEFIRAVSGAGAVEPAVLGLSYCRLGPAPAYPTTELVFEAWTDAVGVLLRLWTPAQTSMAERVGPPWVAGAWIDVACDVDPNGCLWHTVDERVGPAVTDPRQAAEDVRTTAAWLAERLSTESIEGFRGRDPRRGHPVAPRRED